MLDALAEIDAVDLREEAMDEMLPRLLAIGDDVDAGVFLFFQGKQRRVALRFGERVALLRPRRPKHFGFASQNGFGRLPAVDVSSIAPILPFPGRLDHDRVRRNRKIDSVSPVNHGLNF